MSGTRTSPTWREKNGDVPQRHASLSSGYQAPGLPSASACICIENSLLIIKTKALFLISLWRIMYGPTTSSSPVQDFCTASILIFLSFFRRNRKLDSHSINSTYTCPAISELERNETWWLSDNIQMNGFTWQQLVLTCAHFCPRCWILLLMSAEYLNRGYAFSGSEGSTVRKRNKIWKISKTLKITNF